jgi:YspA, cpYpsA-related SLOG family
MRILVTGSRDWPYPGVVDIELFQTAMAAATSPVQDSVVVVDGACPTGADAYAYNWVQAMELEWLTSERHPADWKRYGKSAGFVRNQEMVDLGADLCLVFRLNGSKGATHCLNRATAAGIPCKAIDLAIWER